MRVPVVSNEQPRRTLLHVLLVFLFFFQLTNVVVNGTTFYTLSYPIISTIKTWEDFKNEE